MRQKNRRNQQKSVQKLRISATPKRNYQCSIVKKGCVCDYANRRREKSDFSIACIII